MNTCPDCSTTYPLSSLSCPGCRTLTFRTELQELAERAKEYASQGAVDREREMLEQMLERLPVDAPQVARLRSRLAALGATSTDSASSARAPLGKLAGLGTLGLLLWKFKLFWVFLFTKGKFLLLGLTKVKTALSMLVSLSFYWSVWGWKFALGFILSIYVHEMGHVAALRRSGIAASSPMFIPFVGAFVRLKQAPRTAEEDATVGLAGPIYGLAAALTCYLLYVLTDYSLLGAIARAGAWINLFNLIPVWQLDGGRGFTALARSQRTRMAALVAAAWLISGENLLLLLLLGCGYQLFMRAAPERGDPKTEWTYAALIVCLTALARIDLPAV